MTNILDTIDKRRVVAFKNELLKSAYRKNPELVLSVAQTQLILYCVSMINRDDTEFREVIITPKQFCEHFGFSYNGGNSRKVIIDQINDLMKKRVDIDEPGRTVHCHWVDAINEYKDEKNPDKIVAIGIVLSRFLKPYYLGLKDNFTAYQLGFAGFKKRQSFLLYDFLKRWENYKGICYYPIEDAKRELCEEGRYQDIRDFKKRILIPAVEEINEKSDIRVVWNFAKEGRKVKSICFKIVRKDKEDIDEIKATWNINKNAETPEEKAISELEGQLIIEGFNTEIIEEEI